MKRIVLIIVHLLFVFKANTQTQPFLWSKDIGKTLTGLGSIEEAIAVDSIKNTYITGHFEGIVDFDPGPGTFTLSAPSSTGDIFIMKLDSSSNLIWAKSLAGAASGNDIAYDIKIDRLGSVYVTGGAASGTDFDPGPGTYTLTPSNSPLFILKLDNAGNFVWVKNISGSIISGFGLSVEISDNGDVYAMGTFWGTGDFDPGPGTYTLSSTSANSTYVLKLDSIGNFKWAKMIKSVGGAVSARAMCLDSLNNTYITGSFGGTADFDPGIGTYTVTAGSGGNMFVVKLDSLGEFVWAKNISAPSPVGSECIKLDEFEHIYIVGGFQGTIDFDSGIGTFNLNGGSMAVFVLKLDVSGGFIWAKSMNSGTAISCNDFALDTFGNIYLPGKFQGTADFDPGPGNYSFTSVSYNDIYLTKMDSAGNFVWAKQMSGPNGGDSRAITTDHFGNIYTIGDFGGTIDFDPDAGVFNMTATASDLYIQKFGPCFAPVMPTNISPVSNMNICTGTSTTLTATSLRTINWYASASSTTTLSTGLSYLTPTLTTGTYTYYAEASTCTVSVSRAPITVTVNALPTLTITGNSTVCTGSSASLTALGALTYTWTSGPATASVNVTPTTTATYTVAGKDINNCRNTQTVTVTVDNTCADVWPGDANSDGTADNLDVLELGLHYAQTGPSRATSSNSWQSYFSDNWSGAITNGKNLNHSDCNGDGIIDDNDTLAIYSNYGLTHAFRSSQQTVTNPQLSIVPDQTAVVKGSWGTASVYLGDATNPINTINGIAFTVNFDNTLIEANNVWIEYPSSFINASNQNLNFRKLDFTNNNLYTATTHTISNNVSGNGLIAKLHYQIKSSLANDQALNLGIVQAGQSDASGNIVPLTSGTATLMAMGSSVGIKEFSTGSILIYPNPVKDVLTVQSSNEFSKVELMNVTGQVLLSEDMRTNTYQLNLSSVAKGIYFVNIYQNDKIISRNKVVVAK